MKNEKFSLGKKEIEKRLLAFDEEVSLMFDEGTEFSIYIVGGSALILGDYISRATHDIDVLPNIAKEISPLLKRYDMNTDVKVFINNFDESYVDRATRIIPNSMCVKFYILSVEDLVISKLCSPGTQGREKDSVDINDNSIVNSIDWNQLDEIAKIVSSQQISTIAKEDFDWRYRDYVKRHKK